MRPIRQETSRLAKYGVVGLANTTLSGIVMLVGLWLHADFRLYTSIAYLAGITLSYVLNSIFTFRKRLDISHSLSFFFCSLCVMLLTQGFQALIIQSTDVSEPVGVAAGMVFFTVIGYATNRAIVFRDNRNERK